MKRVVAYYPDWSMYGDRAFTPENINWEKVTHINYAFANIDVDNKSIKLTDDYASSILLPKFRKLSADYPNVKLMISVGGWGYSAGFHTVALNDENRLAFADSCVKFVRDNGFHGVDIDWEYPTVNRDPNSSQSIDRSEAETFPLFLKALRQRLDRAGDEDKKKYLLTAAVGTTPEIIDRVPPKTYESYLDFINIMSYDMNGAWQDITGHLAPLYANPYDPSYTYTKDYLNTAGILERYYSAGIPKEKLVLGIPAYSRGWGSVSKDYPIKDKPYGDANVSLPGLFAKAPTYSVAGISDVGTKEGINPFDYVEEVMEKDDRFTKYFDPWAKTPYLYSASLNQFFTYDDAQSVAIKAQFVNDNSYGGIIMWNLSGDRNHTLITAAYDNLASNDNSSGNLLIKVKGQNFDFVPQVSIDSVIYKLNFNSNNYINLAPGSHDVYVYPARSSDYKEYYKPVPERANIDVYSNFVTEIDVDYQMITDSSSNTLEDAKVIFNMIPENNKNFHYKLYLINESQKTIPAGYKLNIYLQAHEATILTAEGANMVKNADNYSLTITEPLAPWQTKIIKGSGIREDENFETPTDFSIGDKKVELLCNKSVIVTNDSVSSIGNVSAQHDKKSTDLVTHPVSDVDRTVVNPGAGEGMMKIGNTEGSYPRYPVSDADRTVVNPGAGEGMMKIGNAEGSYPRYPVSDTDRTVVNPGAGEGMMKIDEHIEPAGKSSEVNFDIIKNIDLDFDIITDWGPGYNFIISITNNNRYSIEDWILTMDFYDTIKNIWGAEYFIDNSQVKVVPTDGLNVIGPNSNCVIKGSAKRNNVIRPNIYISANIKEDELERDISASSNNALIESCNEDILDMSQHLVKTEHSGNFDQQSIEIQNLDNKFSLYKKFDKLNRINISYIFSNVD